MDDNDDIQLKTEIDEIMNKVDNIMKKIEVLVPQKGEKPAQEEN